MGIIDGGAPVRDLNVPPALKRGEQHEQVGGAVAFVLVIDPLRASPFHRDRRARLGNQLLGGFVQADERHFRIVRLSVDIQHLLHGRYECAIGLRRDDPLFLAVRLKRVFLRTRPIVLSLARSTMPRYTTLSSKSRSVQRARPSGGVEQARAVRRAWLSPSKIGSLAGVARCLRLRTASRPSSTNCWRTRVTMDMLVSSALTIWPSLQPSPCSEASALRSILAFNSRLAGLLPLLISACRWLRSASFSLTTYLFTPASLAAMAKSCSGFSSRQRGRKSSNQTRQLLWTHFRPLNQFAAHNLLNLNDAGH